MTTVLIIGAGDLGERLTARLADCTAVDRVVLAGRSPASVRSITGMTAGSSDCLVEPQIVDASRQEDVAGLIARVRPDLIVQCASLRSPWELVGREDAAARTILAAGFALRLPYQLPIVLSVMRAARAAGYTGPVANLSYPDGTGPVLRALGLAPTVGLGNAAMILRRARAALRAADPSTEPPLVRVLGHHAQLPAAMGSLEPADADERSRVYVGEDGRRDDSLAYRGPALVTDRSLNALTAAAAIPVLEALLPGAAPRRWSTPAPGGLPGGYPVRIADGAVELDLPPGVDTREAIAFNQRAAAGDAIERIDEHGTVYFTAACRAAVRGRSTALGEPLAVADIAERAALLDAILGVERTRCSIT